MAALAPHREEETACPPLPIAPLQNVTNLPAKKQRKSFGGPKKQDGYRHYATLKHIAEEYALLQKGEGEGAPAEAALWGLVHRARAALLQDGAALGPAVSGAGAGPALQELIRPFVPEEEGKALSIGSIPHVHGEACLTGACRFHRKGKCFDGVLCRFCHASGEHVKPAKPRGAPAGPMAARPGKRGNEVDLKALQALFAALDTAHPAPTKQLPMPGICIWPPRAA
jgi:hypothetical protein